MWHTLRHSKQTSLSVQPLACTAPLLVRLVIPFRRVIPALYPAANRSSSRRDTHPCWLFSTSSCKATLKRAKTERTTPQQSCLSRATHVVQASTLDDQGVAVTNRPPSTPPRDDGLVTYKTWLHPSYPHGILDAWLEIDLLESQFGDGDLIFNGLQRVVGTGRHELVPIVQTSFNVLFHGPRNLVGLFYLLCKA